MSAFGSLADIYSAKRHVRFTPIATSIERRAASEFVDMECPNEPDPARRCVETGGEARPLPSHLLVHDQEVYTLRALLLARPRSSNKAGAMPQSLSPAY